MAVHSFQDKGTECLLHSLYSLLTQTRAVLQVGSYQIKINSVIQNLTVSN